MTAAPQTVKRIEYACGMVESVGSMDEMDVRWSTVLRDPNIPQEVSESLAEERILGLRGDFGDPGLALPVEVDLLRFETDQFQLAIRVFNRGITLARFDDGRIRRLHRFFVHLEKAVEGDLQR